MRAALLLSLALALCACTSGTQSTASAEQPASPLGPGYPDPPRVMAQLLEAMRMRDFDALCLHLADLGRRGRPVPLVPGRNVPKIPPGRSDLWPSLAQLEGLRHFMAQPWKRVSYGSPRSLRNDPPLVAVPVRVHYEWERIPKIERGFLLRARSDQQERQLTWAEVVRLGRARERAETLGTRPLPALRFVWIAGSWRFYLHS